MRQRQLQMGFTLIEVLVSIVILAILTVVLTATLTGSLNLNRQSQQQLNTTTSTQQVMEAVRNAWTSQANYNNACAPGVTLPDGYTAKFINLSTRAQPVTQANEVANPASAAPTNALNVSSTSTCTASGNASLSTTPATQPLMRRIVISSGSTPRDTTLTLDVLRPRE